MSVLAAGILAGVVLGVLLTEASLGPSDALWISYHQAIRVPYTLVIPPLGALALVGSVATLIRSHSLVVHRPTILAAVICLIVGMAVTIGVHFPMNTAIDTWSPTAPPDNWEQVRRQWLIAHSARSVLALTAFGLLVVAATRRERRGNGRPPIAGEQRMPHTPLDSLR
jgi:uncharacterized membrane protein